ncbi:Flagellar basal body-associated protein FliL [Candidatus Bealeia paramacronuclearis]|uniref:Flagellar protein FliL n=1 Tax=Candidatus Bealeia paramacronuclearis TaxID=1921001 RepID=A0ABZ2C8R7_9PROT|nr:Flagellar basal body-associated protein FliL [Candidatus Bealeia paramacronuclearis]
MAEAKAAEDAQVVEGAEGQPEEPKKKGSPLKLILMIAVPLLLIGGGAGLYFMGVFGGAKQLSAEEKKAEELKHLQFVDFPDILVNLNTGTKKDKFLKLAITFEVTNEETAKMIESLKPRLVDQFQTYLRELRIEDLQGSEGVHRLREEMTMRVNQELAPNKIHDILFKDILVQ